MQVTSPESSEVPDDAPAVAERLENLQALTDSTLAGLDVDDLLVELLARVRVILDVDTAAVLILDERASELVARARVASRTRFDKECAFRSGRGFAGRIAATKEAVRLDHVDSTTVANPILWERGIKAMLGVPLLRNDTVLGVLHVGRLEPRPFDEEDVELLHVVAERVSGAMRRGNTRSNERPGDARTQPATTEAATYSGTRLRDALRRRRRPDRGR